MLSTIKIFLNFDFNKRDNVIQCSSQNVNFLFLLRYLIILVIGLYSVKLRHIFSTLFCILVAISNLLYDLFIHRRAKVDCLPMQTKKHSIQNNSFSLHSNREPLITFYRKEEIIVLNDKLKLIYLNPSAIKFTNCTNFHELEKFMVMNHFNFKTKKEFYHHFKWLLKYKSNISFLMESCDSKIFPLFKVKKPAQLILTFKPKYSDLNGLFSGIAIFAHIRNKTRQTNWLNNEKKISHELKNHLCNLNSVVETTEEYFLLLSQYQKKLFFVTIKNEITYLEHLIKSLYILENVHSQILPITDFNVILDYIAKSYSVILKRKRLQLQIELSKKNSCIVGNIDSVIQVLSNLINNSVKFNYQGGKIFIRSFKIKKKNRLHYLHIEIIDTGIGIAPKYKDLIFTTIFPMTNFHYKSLKSSRIGLAFIKGLLINNKSKLHISSKLSVGTIFWFDLVLI